MQCSGDRFIYSRAEGYLPSVVYSLSSQDCKSISDKGSYQQSVFSSLFSRDIPKNVRVASFLPEVDSNAAQINATRHKIDRQREQNIPVNPMITLDMPDVADDYYTHSIALCDKRLAVALGSTCYLVEDITNVMESKRVVKELYVSTGALRLRCIEWLNATTVVVGAEQTSDLLVFRVNDQQRVKVHKVAVGGYLDRISRIARLSDSVFLTGYSGGQVAYNDLKTGKSHLVVSAPFPANIVCSIVPSKNARTIAIGYNRGNVDVYNLTAQKTFELIRTYRSTIKAAKRALAWLPGSTTKFIVGGGKLEPELRLFTLTSSNPLSIYKLSNAITNIVFVDDIHFIAAHGSVISHFYVKENEIVLIKDVETKSEYRLLDAVYSEQAGLVTSSAAERLNVWAPMPPQKPTKQNNSVPILAKTLIR